MEAQEVLSKITEKVNFNSLYKPKSREHYKDLMRNGQVFPTTKSQAKTFYKMFKDGQWLTPLYNTDVMEIEEFMNKHGLKGNWKLTKNKRSVRLINTEDLAIAFKKEYNF